MKDLAFVLLGLLFLISVNAEAYPGDTLRLSKQERRAKIFASLKQARAWALEAYTKSQDQEFQKVFKKLSDSKFEILSEDDSLCGGKAYLRATCPGSKFYFCAGQVDRADISEAKLAESLFHEAGHALGYCDECEAENVRIKLMTAIGRNYDKNQGYPRCWSGRQW
jgi:hypothetical protein